MQQKRPQKFLICIFLKRLPKTHSLKKFCKKKLKPFFTDYVDCWRNATIVGLDYLAWTTASGSWTEAGEASSSPAKTISSGEKLESHSKSPRLKVRACEWVSRKGGCVTAVRLFRCWSRVLWTFKTTPVLSSFVRKSHLGLCYAVSFVLNQARA